MQKQILLSLILLIFPITVGAAMGDDWPEVMALKKDMPADVSAFISRAVECHHWAGEEGYEPIRIGEIITAMGKAGCDKLDADAKALRLKYGKDTKILDVLTKVNTTYAW